jgi:hypothetical protein
MNKFNQIIRWLLKAWPLLVVVTIGLVHYLIYFQFYKNAEYTNKIVGAVLQLIGGIIVLYSINDNMGLIKRETLWSAVVSWAKSSPLFKKSVTININGVESPDSFVGNVTVTVKRRGNTINEKIEALEKEVAECRKLIIVQENVFNEKISNIQANLDSSISQNNREIQNVKKLLDDSVVGSIKLQIFGVLLVIYGAFLGLI